jgi:16S rRNA (uracil1498-N3)-methyltransferase
MNQAKPKIRLFVPTPYTAGQALPLEKAQAHYLGNVMRVTKGDAVAVFNGSDGEWLAEVTVAEKKAVTLTLKKQRTRQISTPDLWLAFAPIKNKSELVVEKATELGVSKIMTVITRHCVVKSVNEEKLTAHAIEAAEQCERHDVPKLESHDGLQNLLGAWPEDRTLLYGDESGEGAPLKDLLGALPKGKYAVLIGPEGGFAQEEHRMLAVAPFVKAFGMGPRILRADTAAVAALACVQAWLGDWNLKPKFAAQVKEATC